MPPSPSNAQDSTAPWAEETIGDTTVWRPARLTAGLLVAFSGRAAAPEREPSPTAFLARRFADAIGLRDLPIVRATQVHGADVKAIAERPSPGSVRDAGESDVLVTATSGVGLAIQTADCVPLILAGEHAVAAAHAGWRGSDRGTARAAVDAIERLGASAASLRAWIGPTIRGCCYEVGPEVAARFPGFATSSDGQRPRLDLVAVNRAQLEAAGVPAENIRVHPACTRCGGDRFASYRRDGAAAGRMIALVARLSPLA
jgi:YfiH family protein